MRSIRRMMRRGGVVVGAVALAGVATAGAVSAKSNPHQISFQIVRSGAAVNAGCLKHATAQVTIRSRGPVEVMTITATGLPPRTDFDLFVTQVPNAPFGLSWYQGDLESDSHGRASGTFVGRFSIETFTVAPGSAPAPVVHRGSPFPDASSNPATAPVHQYHLGLWFDSPQAAQAAGCPNTVTPFNGDHHAGIQALSTRNFPDLRGPLSRLRP